MGVRSQKQINRPVGALLAGVCAGIARTLCWNVWVLRVLFVGFLAFKTVLALIFYSILALAMHLLGKQALRGEGTAGEKTSAGLASPELTRRNERIADLEQRFKDMEDSA